VRAHSLRNLEEEEAQVEVPVAVLAHSPSKHHKEVVERTGGVAARPRSSQGVVLESMQAGDRFVVDCSHNNILVVVEVRVGLARLPPDHRAL
jgi:hypothetical protein